jgi:hypothetical protein
VVQLQEGEKRLLAFTKHGKHVHTVCFPSTYSASIVQQTVHDMILALNLFW